MFEGPVAQNPPSRCSAEGAAAQGQRESFLLACRWFDRECAGYLEADDLEEILFMVSDDVSSELWA
jgi:hypothetical protein